MKNIVLAFILITLSFSFINAAEQLCVSSEGINYELKGSITNYQGETFSETCLEREGGVGGRMDPVDKGRFLSESFCTDGLPDSHTYECENLCIDGACVPFDKSSILSAQGGYKIYTKEGTYTVKVGDVIRINNLEGQIDSFPTDSEGNKRITIRYNTASIINLKEEEKGYFFSGSITAPESKNLQIIASEINDDSARITLTEISETIYYPAPIDTVIAKTWIANPYDEAMNCEELCEAFDTEVVINGCLDTFLKACTVASGTSCKSSDSKQMLKKFDGNACCCRIGNTKYTYIESNQQNECTSTDGDNPFARGRTVDVRSNTIYEDKCQGDGVIDYSCDAFGQVVSWIEPTKCPFGCKDGACIKCPTPGDMGDGTYCSEEGPILEKKTKSSYCNYDYECKNSCRDNKCVGIFGRFSSWLKNLFN